MEKLNSDKLKLLNGGVQDTTFYCRCGHTGNYSSECFPLMAGDIIEALSVADYYCGEPGNTCSGEQCPT
jgi:hypothetical protein